MNPEPVKFTHRTQGQIDTRVAASCPNCSAPYIKRVRRTTLYQRLASLFCLYPFRCQLCDEDFQLFQPGVRYVRIDEDQREYERVPADLPVELLQAKNNCSAMATDISLGGCTVRTQEPLPLGSLVKLNVTIPGDLTPLVVDAAMVRNSGNNRLGLEFLKIQGRERTRLKGLLQHLRATRH